MVPLPAFAATQETNDLTMTQAENIARQTFSIASSYTVQNQSYEASSQIGTNPTYTFTFQNPDPAKAADTISVGVDAVTGLIVSYDHYDNSTHFQFPVPTSQAQAETLANSWAKKLYPKQVGQVKMSMRPYQSNSLGSPVQYEFDFERQVNGIAAPFDGFSIVIDQNGNLQAVEDHWSNLTFPTSKPAISQTTADTTFKQALGLHLEYDQIWRQNKNPSLVLEYTPAQTTFPNGWNTTFSAAQAAPLEVIDANSGKLLDSTGATHAATNYQAPAPLDATAADRPLLGTKVNWDKDTALAFAEKTLGIGNNWKLTNENESSSPTSDTMWNFSWINTTANAPSQNSINVQIDATYGDISSYNAYQTSNSQNDGKTLSQQRLNQIANQFIRKVFAGHLHNIAVVPQAQADTNQPMTSYNIVSFTNGVQDALTSGSLNIDAHSGQVNGLYMNSANQVNNTYPAPNEAVDVTTAKQDWLKSEPLQLTYLMTDPTNGKTPSQDASEQPQVVLAYVPTPTGAQDTYYDALQGKFLPNDGMDITPYTGAIQDIAGSPDAAQIELLAARGLIAVDASGDVHPNSTMTNAAFIKLVMDALGTVNRYAQDMTANASVASAVQDISPNDPGYKELVTAYALGWLNPNDPLDPDASVTRNTAAHVLAEALGYNGLLDKPNLFNLQAQDAGQIDKTDFAADAIAVGLNLLSLQNDQFDGSDNLTLADAAQGVVAAANLMGKTNTGVIEPLM